MIHHPHVAQSGWRADLWINSDNVICSKAGIVLTAREPDSRYHHFSPASQPTSPVTHPLSSLSLPLSQTGLIRRLNLCWQNRDVKERIGSLLDDTAVGGDMGETNRVDTLFGSVWGLSTATCHRARWDKRQARNTEAIFAAPETLPLICCPFARTLPILGFIVSRRVVPFLSRPRPTWLGICSPHEGGLQ